MKGQRIHLRDEGPRQDPALVASSVRNVYGDASKVSAELVDRYFELTLREGNRRALAQRLKQLDLGAGAARIREVKAPTLILWGGRGRLIPPDSARRFAADIRGQRMGRVRFTRPCAA